MVVACHWCILMCLICLGRQKMKVAASIPVKQRTKQTSRKKWTWQVVKFLCSGKRQSSLVEITADRKVRSDGPCAQGP